MVNLLYTSRGYVILLCLKSCKLLKGKSSLMIYEKWGNMKYKYRNRSFWCRGYYVSTVGKNEKKITEYIQNQLKEDYMSEQLVLDMTDPFTGSRK